VQVFYRGKGFAKPSRGAAGKVCGKEKRKRDTGGNLDRIEERELEKRRKNVWQKSR
jgi:hypothetical protein